MLYGAVHSKWEKSKIDWLNPQTELMFGTQALKDLKQEFSPKGPNAFQRKLNQLADTKNIDIINEEKSKEEKSDDEKKEEIKKKENALNNKIKEFENKEKEFEKKIKDFEKKVEDFEKK